MDDGEWGVRMLLLGCSQSIIASDDSFQVTSTRTRLMKPSSASAWGWPASLEYSGHYSSLDSINGSALRKPES